MSLLDFFRKKLLGEANVMQPSGFEPGVNTQGLFGKGGEFGGGLLQNNLTQMNQGEGGLLSNIPEAAILGSAIYGQGIKGKDPLEAFFPAAMQTASFSKAMKPKKTELQKNLEAAGYKAGTAEYKAALNAYLNKGKKNTLSQEALALYKSGQAAPDFNKWFDKLNQAEKDLYKKQVKPNEGNIEQILNLSKEMNEELLKTAIPIPMKNGSPDISGLKLQEGLTYNFNNQLLVWDGERLIPYKDRQK